MEKNHCGCSKIEDNNVWRISTSLNVMNQLLKSCFPLLISLILISCSKSDLQYESKFETSVRAWESFKKESDNSYSYTTRSGSWTGWTSEITTTVDQGKIKKIAYIVPKLSTTNRPEGGWTLASFSEALKKMGYTDAEIKKHEEDRTFENIEWIEDESNFGEHGNTLQRTLDDIYRLAKEDWLVKRKGVTNYLETENNGLISKVGKYEEGCMDDCFIGVDIVSIVKN